MKPDTQGEITSGAVHEKETSVVLMANRVGLLEHYLVEVDSVCVHTRAATCQCYLKTFPTSKLSRSEREERKDRMMVVVIEQL